MRWCHNVSSRLTLFGTSFLLLFLRLLFLFFFGSFQYVRLLHLTVDWKPNVIVRPGQWRIVVTCRRAHMNGHCYIDRHIDIIISTEIVGGVIVLS